MTVRVVIADDHPAFVLGLRLGLEAEGIDVVGTAGDSLGAVERVAATEPDAVVLDVRMPGCSGVEACREVHALFPTTAIVMMSTYDDAATRNEAREAGARAFLTKDSSPRELAETIRRLVVEPTLILLSTPVLPDLTDREKDVLRGLGAGLGNKAIAHRLRISPDTVKDHCSSIFGKLLVDDRTQAVLEAQRLGLLPAGWPPPRTGVRGEARDA